MKMTTVDKDYARICKMFNLLPRDVLVISGSSDPLYDFWSHIKNGALAKACCVVFLRCPGGVSWRDLEDYPGVQMGNAYLMQYDPVTYVKVRPSQRGLFLRR
jgi:hypothetical protein